MDNECREMIESLRIRNFKSIKDIELKCSRINMLIGEPNTGKSNILEALGMLSFLGHGGRLNEFIRFETMPDIFFNKSLDDPIQIAFDQMLFTMKFEDGKFYGTLQQEAPIFSSDYHGSIELRQQPRLKPFKFYRFRILKDFTDKPAGPLLPPTGSNLLALIMMSKFVRSTIGDLLGSFGWKLVIKPYEKRIEFQREFDNIVVSLPYISLSDTIQRIIFYLTAILSNKDSVIVFEEPEAHAFPYYTKFLAEQIALDDRGNQYFISTHNPYFLLSVIEKSKMDVSVFITYLEEGETKVKQLVGKKLEQLLEYDVDVFFNLESLIEGSS